MTPLTNVTTNHGAPMGRSDRLDDADASHCFEIEPLQWVDGDYDQGGAYWGAPQRKGTEYIFRAESIDATEEMFIRASSISDARAIVLDRYPNSVIAESSDLESFLNAYIEAALWSTANDRAWEEDEHYSDEEPPYLGDTGRDLAEKTRQLMRKDCAEFMISNASLLSQAYATGYSVEQAGHDYWLTRNGLGVGFWDRGLGDIGDRLSDACRYTEVDLYTGDDDLIYQGW